MITNFKLNDNLNFNSIGLSKKSEPSNGVAYIEYKNKITLEDTQLLSNLYLDLKTYQQQPNNQVLFFDNDKEKRSYKNADDELILRITPDGKEGYLAQTGNYIGTFKYNDVDIQINSRFGDAFLQRMLNFANNIFLDDISIADKEQKNSLRWIIYYLFLQALEKAALLGFPKTYQTVKHHEFTLLGQLDINNYIQRDIPFMGKISSKSREQHLVPEIIDVLAAAVQIIAKDKTSNGLLAGKSNLQNFLRQYRRKQLVTQQTINQAKTHKSLANPLFIGYRQVLNYAEMIIKHNTVLPNASNDQQKSTGFIMNVAELFEIYVRKLLQINFPDWAVESPKLLVYKGMFYQRNIIPDIVMTNGERVVVLDTKYKTMKFTENNQFGMGDVDRHDFFQIHTYISYYQSRGKEVVLGGLIYPLQYDDDNFRNEKSHHLGLFTNQNESQHFIIDGIKIANNAEDLIEAERDFIERINGLIA